MTYKDPGASHYEERYRSRVLGNLQRRAKAFGYFLQEVPDQGDLAVSQEGGNLLCRPKPVRFAFIETWKETWPAEFLCRVMQGTSRGFGPGRAAP
jgi:hypothetical protein